MALESESDSSEFIRSIEDLEEESPRSTPNERRGSSQSQAASGSPVVGKRPRGRPRKGSATSSPVSPASASSIRSTPSGLLGRPRRGRPPGPSRGGRTVPQSALAAKRITRLAAGQSNFSRKASLGATRTPKSEKQEPADEMLLSLGLKKVAPASAKANGSSSLSLPMAKLRALALDLFFATTPDPQSVSLVHSLLPPGVELLSPAKVCYC